MTLRFDVEVYLTAMESAVAVYLFLRYTLLYGARTDGEDSFVPRYDGLSDARLTF